MSNAMALKIYDTQAFPGTKMTAKEKLESEKNYRLLDEFVSGKGKRLETTEYIEYIF